MSDPSCVFCEIVAGTAPATIVKDWDVAIALVPLTPVVDGHVLIIPKLHVAHAAEDPDTAANTMACAAEYAGIHGSFNLVTSAGRAATQSVDHLHIHVVPRTEDDGLMLPWGTIYGDDPSAPHWCRVAQRLQARLDALGAPSAYGASFGPGWRSMPGQPGGMVFVPEDGTQEPHGYTVDGYVLTKDSDDVHPSSKPWGQQR
jgi:histidine triad (HIT) family protein